MTKFLHNLKPLGLALACMAVASASVTAQVSNAMTVTINVTDVKSTDATVTITPSDAAAGFFFDLKTKAAYEAAGGAEKVVENQIKAWESNASWYDDTDWKDIMELNRKTAAEEFSAKEYLYASLQPETEYVVYAYSLDAEGNLTIPVTEKFFTTTGAIPSDNTFAIKIDKIEAGKFNRMTVTATVTPSNDDTYTAQCVLKATADGYDLTPGGEEYKQFITEELLYGMGVDEVVSGKHEFVFDRKVADQEYSIFVVGLDADGAVSTGLTRLDFVAKEIEPLAIEVTDITSTDALVTITPADAEAGFFFDLKTKADYDAAGGAEKVVENQIKAWEFTASWYDDTDWKYFMELNRKTGVEVFSAKEFIYASLQPETEYVVYAYSLDAEGNLTIPVTEQVFTTKGGIPSDNTFVVTLNKITAGSFGRMQVTATVTPSNTDSYTMQCVLKSVADEYDLTPGTDSYKKFISSELLNGLGVDEIVSGEHEFVFDKRTADTEYSLFVIGLDVDGAPSTGLTRLDIVTKEYPVLPEFKIEVTDVTSMNAHIKITPPDDDMYYYFDVSPKSIVEQKGGYDAIAQELVIEWWKFLSSLYNEDTWWEWIPLQCRKGALDAMAADLYGSNAMSTIYWNDDWVLYAVGFNEAGDIISKTAVAEFTTPKPEESDLTFTFEVVSIEKNEKATEQWGKTMFDATIDIYPSNDEETYKFNNMATRFLDQYGDTDEDRKEFIKDQFLEYAVTATGAARVEMPQLQAVRAGATQDFYLIAMGWNEGPTTPICTYKFAYDEQDGVTATEVRDTEVVVMPGSITVIGNCDGAAVYSTSGQLVGTIRSGYTLNVAPGMYLVSYQVDGKTLSKKVIVK